MNKQRFVRKVVAAAVLAAFGASGMALAADEMEPNHPMSSAQKLVIEGTTSTGKGIATINGAIVHFDDRADVDFYSFYAEAGDFVTLDIDGTSGLDSVITLFGPMSSLPLENDDAGLSDLDEGSTSFYDSLIADFAILESGTYTVAVTAYGTFLSSTGTYDSTDVPSTSGAYTLIVSGMSLPEVAEPAPEEPEVTHIDINVKPGQVGRTRVTRDKGVIPVALMSSDKFDATKVDAKTVTFGKTGNEASLRHCAKGTFDFNKDGRPDLMCHFENHLANFAPGDLEAFVKGKTTDGGPFQGRGSLKAVPEKRDRSATSERRDRPTKGRR